MAKQKQKNPSPWDRVNKAVGEDFVVLKSPIYGFCLYRLSDRKRLYRNPGMTASRLSHGEADKILDAIKRSREDAKAST